MTPLWFFFFAKADALFTNATVAAASRARACELLEPIIQRMDPANSVALRRHPKRDHLWTGEDVALVNGGQAEVPEGVLEVTDRATGKRMICLGSRGDGDFVWRATAAPR